MLENQLDNMSCAIYLCNGGHFSLCRINLPLLCIETAVCTRSTSCLLTQMFMEQTQMDSFHLATYLALYMHNCTYTLYDSRIACQVDSYGLIVLTACSVGQINLCQQSCRKSGLMTKFVCGKWSNRFDITALQINNRHNEIIREIVYNYLFSER